MPAPKPTAAVMARALEAWIKAGLAVGKTEVTPDGGFIITAPQEATNPSSTANGGPKQWPKGV